MGFHQPVDSSGDSMNFKIVITIKSYKHVENFENFENTKKSQLK